MRAISEREEGLKKAKESTDFALKEAEKVRKELDSRLAELKTEIKERMDEARSAARKEKDALLDDARKSAAAITESAKKEIEAERVAALRDMRRRVSEISILTTEKVLKNVVNVGVNAQITDKYLGEVEKERPDLKLGADKN